MFELFAGVIICIGWVGVAAFLFERSVMSRLHALNAWLTAYHDSKFSTMSLMPPLSGDEFDATVRELSAVAANATALEARLVQLEKQHREFLSIASHQLRTPLNGIEWGLETLLGGESSGETREVLIKEMRDALQRMILIVKNFIDSAAIEEGNFGYVFEQRDVTRIIADLVKSFQILAQSQGITLAFAPEQSPLMAELDEQRFLQATSNILLNAIEYTIRGGTVTISVTSEPDAVRISVKDSGIGMSEADIANLFTKFYRGASAKHTKPNGSGLGLYVAKNVLDEHRATIRVQSREGLGSTFTIVMPLKHLR